MRNPIRKKLISFVMMAVLLSSSTVSVRCDKPAGLDKDHVIDEYQDNEPLFVHTPVISPVVIEDEDGNDIPTGGFGTTELEIENKDAKYQLRLDTNYIMHWASMTHRDIDGYGDSDENPSKYDKYTKDKWMKFPFEVLYDGKFYDLQADGKTEWIQVKKPASWDQTTNNHWIDTPIYIPSYAKETGDKDHPAEVLYKVEAINVDGDLAEHFEEEEENGNVTISKEEAPDGAKYVATYRIKVQLSGWLYDFTITGVNNGSVYAGKSEVGSEDLPFAMAKSEKKAGTKNRFGKADIRYLVDGSLTDSWDALDTVPLTDGKSKQYTKQGALWKGQSFSFELKTISNMWNDNNEIVITPTFTYVSNTGNKVEQDKLLIFYHNPDGSGKYIEYDSKRDKNVDCNWTYSKIGTPMQEGAYYTKDMSDNENGGKARKYHFGDWSTFTADAYNNGHTLTPDKKLNSEKILGRESKTCCLSMITLNSKRRLFSGEWEQLSENTKKTPKQDPKAFENVRRYSDLDNDKAVDSTWKPEDTVRFRKSMQTWYGEYYIPADLFIIDLNKHPEFEDPNYDLYKYMTTANGGLGITEDDPVFEKEGYLIINFEIKAGAVVTKADGTKSFAPYLKYYSDKKEANMWKTEGYNNAPLAGDPTPITSFKDGDVVVVDLGKSVKDKYSSGVHNVN